MYLGFNLKTSAKILEEHFETGNNRQNSIISRIQPILENYLNSDGFLNASGIIEDWFPDIDVDIFISHSHRDKNLAIALSGWLYNNFKIKSFIDSLVWGNADDLLKKIDNEYCFIKGENTYNYTLRNISTGHVHMMLSTAVAKLIDKSECIIFLNTPNSISVSNLIDKTASPWIYNEIVLTQIIRKRSKEDHRGKLPKRFGRLIESKGLDVEYDVDLSHLSTITFSSLDQWLRKYQSGNYDFPLDALYELFG